MAGMPGIARRRADGRCRGCHASMVAAERLAGRRDERPEARVPVGPVVGSAAVATRVVRRGSARDRPDRCLGRARTPACRRAAPATGPARSRTTCRRCRRSGPAAARRGRPRRCRATCVDRQRVGGPRRDVGSRPRARRAASSTTVPGSTPTTVSRTRQASPSATSIRSVASSCGAAPDLEPLADAAGPAAAGRARPRTERGAVVAAVGAAADEDAGRSAPARVMASPRAGRTGRGSGSRTRCTGRTTG